VLKFRPIPTRIAGEEAFLKNHEVTIMTSSGHVTSSGAYQSTAHGYFAIGCPLEPSRYLASFPTYMATKLRQRLLCDDITNDVVGGVA